MYFNNMDSTENYPVYNRGDIVWVKLGSCWWPGEVKIRDDLPSDLLLNFKKPPLVIVKFFDEDSYEFVKSRSHILPYNCERKKDFIKKGMVGYRSKLTHMTKFPKDIGTAEEKTNGNTNILSLPEFLPTKKVNYSEIFGSPAPKKSPKVFKKTPVNPAAKSLITHRRFLGNDDYKAYICPQYPGKYVYDSDNEDTAKFEKEPNIYVCNTCQFSTRREEVFILHYRSHNTDPTPPSKRKLSTHYKSHESELSDSLDSENATKSPKAKKKRQYKGKGSIRSSNNLGDGNVSESESKSVAKKSTKTSKTYSRKMHLLKGNQNAENNYKGSKKSLSKSKQKNTNSGPNTSQDSSESLLKKNTQDDIKNCFDFDEEDEDEIIIPVSSGRKIPRVIPQKPKTSIAELMKKDSDIDEELPDIQIRAPQTESSAEDSKIVTSHDNAENEQDIDKDEILKTSESFNRSSPELDAEIEQAFKHVMEETAIPKLIDNQRNLKSEQNFHDAKTVKFPDKGGTKSLKGGGGGGGVVDTPSMINKDKMIITPKEKTVSKRSFDDFEAGFHKTKNEEKEKTSDHARKHTGGNSSVPQDTQNSSILLEQQSPNDMVIPSDEDNYGDRCKPSNKKKKDGEVRSKSHKITIHLKRKSETLKDKGNITDTSRHQQGKSGEGADVNKEDDKHSPVEHILISDGLAKKVQGAKSDLDNQTTNRRKTRLKLKEAESLKQETSKENTDATSLSEESLQSKKKLTTKRASEINTLKLEKNSTEADNVQSQLSVQKITTSEPTGSRDQLKVEDNEKSHESRIHRAKKRQLISEDSEQSRKKERLEENVVEALQLTESSNDAETEADMKSDEMHVNKYSKRQRTSSRKHDKSTLSSPSKKIEANEIKKSDGEIKKIKSDDENIVQNVEESYSQLTANSEIVANDSVDDKILDTLQQKNTSKKFVKKLSERRGKTQRNKSKDSHTSTEVAPELILDSPNQSKSFSENSDSQEATYSHQLSRTTRSKSRKLDEKLTSSTLKTKIETTVSEVNIITETDKVRNENRLQDIFDCTDTKTQDSLIKNLNEVKEANTSSIKNESLNDIKLKASESDSETNKEAISEEEVNISRKFKTGTSISTKLPDTDPSSYKKKETEKAKTTSKEDEKVTFVEISQKGKSSRSKKHVKDTETMPQSKNLSSKDKADTNISSPTRSSQSVEQVLKSGKNKQHEIGYSIDESVGLKSSLGNESEQVVENKFKNQGRDVTKEHREKTSTLTEHDDSNENNKATLSKISEINVDSEMNLEQESKDSTSNDEPIVAVKSETSEIPKVEESVEELLTDVVNSASSVAISTKNKIKQLEKSYIDNTSVNVIKPNEAGETNLKSEQLDAPAEKIKELQQLPTSITTRNKTIKLSTEASSIREIEGERDIDIQDLFPDNKLTEVNTNSDNIQINVNIAMTDTPKQIQSGRVEESSKIEMEQLLSIDDVEKLRSFETEICGTVPVSEEHEVLDKRPKAESHCPATAPVTFCDLQTDTDVVQNNEQLFDATDHEQNMQTEPAVVQEINVTLNESSCSTNLKNVEQIDDLNRIEVPETENQCEFNSTEFQTVKDTNLAMAEDISLQESKIDEVELILPLKKSKRTNEVNSKVPEETSKTSEQDDLLTINKSDKNIEIIFDDQKVSSISQCENDKEKSAEVIKATENSKEIVDIFKCVPPKKKKLEVMKPDTYNSVLNNESTTSKSEVLQPPKKKMQKLFESTQVLERTEKSTTEMPLMSPLAKKKSFLFQEEDYEQVQDLIVATAATISAPLQSTEFKQGNTTHKVDEALKLPAETVPEVIQNSVEPEVSVQERDNLSEKIKIIPSVSDSTITETTKQPPPVNQNETGNKAKEILGSSKEHGHAKIKHPVNIPPVKCKLNIVRRNGKFEVQKKDVSQDLKSSPKKENNDTLNQTDKTIEEVSAADDLNSSMIESTIPAGVSLPFEPELVPIEGTLTVMSEKDLADVQVEITPDKVINEKKPTMTIGSFSLDFAEPTGTKYILSPSKHKKENSSPKRTIASTTTADTTPMDIATSTISYSTIEMALKANEIETKISTPQPNLYTSNSELLDILEGNSSSSSNSNSSDAKIKTAGQNDKKDSSYAFDFEEAIPPQIVLSNKLPSTSTAAPKLLERLAVPEESNKPKLGQAQKGIKIEKSVTEINRPKPIINKISKAFHQKIIIKPKIPSTSVGVSTLSTASISGNQLASKASTSNKPIILSEQIIRPANTVTKSTIARQPTSKPKSFEDLEDIETFIIPKVKTSSDKVVTNVAPESKQKVRTVPRAISGKANILRQTIITSKGDIIHPRTTTTTVQSTELVADDSMFDINSMPILLSDDLLTAENIQEMPVVLSHDLLNQNQQPTTSNVLTKLVSNAQSKQQIVLKTSVRQPVKVKQRMISNPVGNRLSKTVGTVIDTRPPGTSRLIVTQPAAAGSHQGKIIKGPIRKQIVTTTKTSATPLDTANQLSGHKVMVYNNQYGTQERIMLTPEQQRMVLQGKPLTGKITKTIIKGSVARNIVPGQQLIAGPSGTLSRILSAGGSIVKNAGNVIGKSGVKTTVVQPKKIIQKVAGKTSKTILIRNQMGQPMRKFQATDNEELDRQVAEQLEAIRASTRLQQASKVSETTSTVSGSRPVASAANKPLSTPTTLVRRSYSKKVPSAVPTSQTKVVNRSQMIGVTSSTEQSNKLSSAANSTDLVLKTRQPQQVVTKHRPDTKTVSSEVKPVRQPHQVILQDASGNQTTLTEGQIVAMPIDGQPPSYMLVTLDESGNLIPLSNEALMSLDPSLGLGGDVNNIVLQIDQGQGVISAATKPVETASSTKKVEQQIVKPNIGKSQPVQQIMQQETQLIKQQTRTNEQKTQDVVLPIPMNEGLVSTEAEPNQATDGSLLYSGEQLTAEKILEAIPGGAAELEKLLAEGGTLLINGQPVIIKTDGADDQPLISLPENVETPDDALFTSHKPNQDILAAALADTDVFQASDTTIVQPPESPTKTIQPTAQLSPNNSNSSVGSTLYPMNVGRVLETSLTLTSPIMTPLEVPSTNSKKIDDEAEILNQVPKNVDLPITITDPNISQTVAQQAVGLIELSLPLSETSSSGTGELNSPSTYINTLATGLEETDSLSQKSFGGNMPLLTDDSTTESDITSTGKTSDSGGFESSFISLPLLAESDSNSTETDKTKEIATTLPMLTEGNVTVQDHTSEKPSRSLSASPTKEDLLDSGLSRLGGQMCSSLSEPPPDMFDLEALTTAMSKNEETSSDLSSIEQPMEPESESSLQSEGSDEIPLQPQIVARLNDLEKTNINEPDYTAKENDVDQD